jgi:hypothetical protein
LADQRLNRRALQIAAALCQGYGQALSTSFQDGKQLKECISSLRHQKVQLEKLTQPHRQTTAKVAATLAVVMCVGETTYLDQDLRKGHLNRWMLELLNQVV